MVFIEHLRDIDRAIPRQINLNNAPAEPKKETVHRDCVFYWEENTLKYTTFGLYEIESKIGRLLEDGVQCEGRKTI